jgi:hypothetical protein
MSMGSKRPMLGSLITRPVRFATRATWWGAKTSLNVAGEVINLVTGHHGSDHDGDHDGAGRRPGAEPAVWRGPAASSTSAPADAPAAPAPQGRPAAQRTATAPQVNGSAAAATESGVTAAQAESASAPSPVEEADRPGDRPWEAQAEVVEAEVVEAEVVPDTPLIDRSEPAVDYDTPTPIEPEHVSEEAELVEESADPGAEDGAGAQIRIGEPWPGYRTMKAAEIVARIESGSPAELAAVELFEMSGRKRKSVLQAAERALRRANPPRSR